MKKMRDEKGITLITLVMTMIILTVLTITITASLDSTTEIISLALQLLAIIDAKRFISSLPVVDTTVVLLEIFKSL